MLSKLYDGYIRITVLSADDTDVKNVRAKVNGAWEDCTPMVKVNNTWKDVKKAYDTDEEGTSYTAILDNDSVYYPALIHGTEIPIEMRGENRPVVPYNWLINNYMKS